MDLISREAALAILHECGGDEITPPNMIEMRGRMHRLPAVDAVEVVRCAECKHSSLMPGTTDLYLCGKLYTGIRAKDFCSYGELQTNCGADMRGNPNDS